MIYGNALTQDASDMLTETGLTDVQANLVIYHGDVSLIDKIAKETDALNDWFIRDNAKNGDDVYMNITYSRGIEALNKERDRRVMGNAIVRTFEMIAEILGIPLEVNEADYAPDHANTKPVDGTRREARK